MQSGGRAFPPRILIIGAGPTGLGAGYRLKELGHERFVIVDRNDYLGGLAASFRDEAGFTWDVGGHVLFSHYEYYDRVFERLMGPEFTLNDRESWVRCLDRWVPYPFQNNIRYLPAGAAADCLAGLVNAALRNAREASGPRNAANFAEFCDRVFGEGIVRNFMRPYNFKVWAHPPEMLGTRWVGERVAVVDAERAIRNVVLGRDDFGWGPNNRFKFPLRGGTGEFYRRFGPVLEGHLRLGVGVESIDLAARTAVLSDGSMIEYDELLSTMPVDVLCRDVIRGGRGLPASVVDAACSLKHASGHMVGLGLRRPCPSTRSWMYFAGDECPFYRVTYLSNYSPHMTPDADSRAGGRHYSLLCETSSSALRPVDRSGIVEATIAGLERTGVLEPGERGDIVSRWVRHVEYSYPVPTTDRDDLLAEVIPALADHRVHSRGRFGLWKYEVSNTDHSLMQGVEWASRVLLGDPETTMGLRYDVTPDGRHAGRVDTPAAAYGRAGAAAGPA